MAAFSWPLSRQTVLDLNGNAVAGAQLRFFLAGTTTPLIAYADDALSVPLPASPDFIPSDAHGRWPRVYLPYRNYREEVRSAAGVLLWNDDGIANPPPASSGGGGTVPDSERFKTGDPKWSFEPGQISGFVRLNALTIGNASSGATERANADTEALFIWLWSRLDNTVCPVSGGRGVSGAVDYAAGKTLGLPDWRGRAPFGLDTMGNAAASRLTGATFDHGNATTPGAYGGRASNTLVQANLPAVAPTGTVSGSINNITVLTSIGSVAITPGGAGDAAAKNPVTSSVPISFNGPLTFSGNPLGSSAAFNGMPGFGLVTWHLKL